MTTAMPGQSRSSLRFVPNCGVDMRFCTLPMEGLFIGRPWSGTSDCRAAASSKTNTRKVQYRERSAAVVHSTTDHGNLGGKLSVPPPRFVPGSVLFECYSSCKALQFTPIVTIKVGVS